MDTWVLSPNLLESLPSALLGIYLRVALLGLRVILFNTVRNGQTVLRFEGGRPQSDRVLGVGLFFLRLLAPKICHFFLGLVMTISTSTVAQDPRDR